MRDNPMMRTTLLYAALLLPIWTASAQNTGTNTTERPRSTPGYFVDEIGLRMAADLAPEGFIDAKTYVLGASDLLSVEVKGAIPAIWRGLTVNVSGDIVIPSVGSIHVGGLTLTDATAAIRRVVGNQFRNADIQVTLERPRNVIVHVTGDVPSPGRYQFPAMTRVDALVIPILTGVPPSQVAPGDAPSPRFVRQSGGILELNRNPVIRHEGSRINPNNRDALANYDLRNIQIRLPEGGLMMSDLVAYFQSGDLDANPFLPDGAHVHIFRLSDGTARISISGGVLVSFETVFRRGDTPRRLIELAGGFSQEADSTTIWVVRNNGTTTASLIETDLDQQLLPNDRVIVHINPDYKKNESVWVSGEVLRPGNYPIVGGRTTVADLIKMSGGTSSLAHGRAAYLERGFGAQSRQLEYDLLYQRIRRTSDQLTEGFDYLNNDFSLNQRLLFLNIDDSLTARRIRLHDGDRLVIPRDEGSILVFGQVNQTGYYAFRDGKSVDEYIASAGGLALSSDPNRVFVIKAGSNAWQKPDETRLETGDLIFVDRVPYESLTTYRQYQLQERQLQLSRNQFYLSVVATIASLVTTAIIITSR
jgi:polysaccharide export outer membrane protein